MKRRGWTRTQVIVSLVLVLAACCFIVPCGGPIFPFEFILYMAFGWALFLYRVSGQIQPEWSSIIGAAVSLVIFTAGLHAFCRWLYSAQPAPQPDEPKRSAWKIPWTLSAVTIIVLFFVAGISMVGITHQFYWLATSKEPIIASTSIAGRRMSSQNNLKHQALGFHNYHDSLTTLPSGMIASSQGEALHGWQTEILPYVEQRQLYDQIDLTKSWRDVSQKAAFATKVGSYTSPAPHMLRSDDSGYALSHYAANQHVIGGTRKMKLDEIIDGTANTILAGEAAGNYKPWGYPRNWRDPALGINVSPEGFGSPWPGGANVAMADGSVRFLNDKMSPEVLRALATPAGGEKIPSDE